MVVDMSGKTLSFFSEEVDAETLDAIMAKRAEDCHPRTRNDGSPGRRTVLLQIVSQSGALFSRPGQQTKTVTT